MLSHQNIKYLLRCAVFDEYYKFTAIFNSSLTLFICTIIFIVCWTLFSIFFCWIQTFNSAMFTNFVSYFSWLSASKFSFVAMLSYLFITEKKVILPAKKSIRSCLFKTFYTVARNGDTICNGGERNQTYYYDKIEWIGKLAVGVLSTLLPSEFICSAVIYIQIT